MNVFIDIETIPQQPEDETKALIAETIKHPATMSKQETIDDWHNGVGKYSGVKDKAIEEAYLKTSFDGSKGEIVSIAWAIEDEAITSSSRSLEESEKSILQDFFSAVVLGKNGRVPYFIGHYISGFDLAFLFQRAVILGVNPCFDLHPHGRHGKDYFDNMIAWAGYKNSISQDNLCRALGIEGKSDDIDGSQVWDFVKAGNIDRVSEYNRDDVNKVRQVYKRITFK